MPLEGNIAKNTSYLTMAFILQKIISFTYFTLLARFIGPAGLGKYYLAISFTSIFSIFTDLGFTSVLTREVAKEKSRSSEWLDNILALKIGLSILVIVATVSLVNLLPYDPLTRQLVYLAAVAMVLDSFTTTFFAVLRGHHILKYESLSAVIFQLIILIAGYGSLRLGGGLLTAMGAIVLASLYNFLFSWIILKRRLPVKIQAHYDPILVRRLLIIAWPFAIYAVLQTSYTYLDSIFLSLMAGDRAVGLYQIAFKIVLALQFLPIALSASLYPALSAYWRHDRSRLAGAIGKAMNYLIIIALPITIGTIVLADKFVLLFKGEYADAVWPLRLSVAALFFIFLNYPIGAALNACDAQHKNTLNMAIVAAGSLILNLILIPLWQALGASLTVLVTNLLMFVLGLRYLYQIVDYRWRQNLSELWSAALAAGLMGIILMVGRSYFNIFLLIVLGMISYFLILFGLGGIKVRDIKGLIATFKKSEGSEEFTASL